MAKNLVQDGRYLTIPVASEVGTTAGVGDVFFYGTHGFGVVISKTSDSVVVDTEGVWALPKKKADLLAVGGVAFFDASNNYVEKATASGNKPIGVILGGTDLRATKDGQVFVRLDRDGAPTKA